MVVQPLPPGSAKTRIVRTSFLLLQSTKADAFSSVAACAADASPVAATRTNVKDAKVAEISSLRAKSARARSIHFIAKLLAGGFEPLNRRRREKAGAQSNIVLAPKSKKRPRNPRALFAISSKNNR
jgi:hypothetical protein